MSAPAKKKQGSKRGAASEDSSSNAAAASSSGAEVDTSNKRATGVASTPATTAGADGEDLEFEDPYGDEMDEEAEVTAAKKKKEAKAAAKAKGKKATASGAKNTAGAATVAAPSATSGGDAAMEDDAEGDFEEVDSDEDEEIDEATATRLAEEEAAAEEAGEGKRPAKYVWRPGADTLNEDEKLDYDSTAYNLLHRMRVDWPCLSFDVLPDQLGGMRTKYPLSMYLVSGTQADQSHKNKVMLLKLSDLHKTKHDERDEDDDDEDSDEDPDDLDDEPILEEKCFNHPGAVNRIRVCPHQPELIATHADTGKVHIWNVAPYVAALDAPVGGPASAAATKAPPSKATPLFTFSKGVGEGYSMAWNPHKTRIGSMVTGDGAKNIWNWTMKEGGNWVVDASPFKGHSSSVEDLVWSPSEDGVFASASSDKTIRVWDLRITKDKCQAWVAAHKSDVNVLDWNTLTQHLLVSGADDGSVKVWDLRSFKSGAPGANFNWHRGAITSVEWNPLQETCVAVSSADDSISVWDMALEHDEMPGHGAQMQEDVPPQLFFVHQGQKQIKELHWHKQIPNCVISTAEDGFNIFKPSNLD